MKKAVFAAIVPILALTTPAFAQSPALGTAKGTFTAGGTTTSLRYAYALEQTSDFDAKKKEIGVLLSDIPLSGDQIEEWATRSKMAREGKLNAVFVAIDPADQSPTTASLYHKAFQGSMSLSGSNRFKPTTFTKTRIAGRLSIPEKTDFDNHRYVYDAVFNAAIRPMSLPTFTGAAAQNSSAGKAALAFFTAMRTGKIEAIKPFLGPEQLAQLNGPDGPKMLEMGKAFAPDPKTAQISSVTIKGGVATVVITKKEKDSKETTTIKFTGAPNGPWKVKN